jgi:hypothetical protein
MPGIGILLGDTLRTIGRYRHLQVIIAIILLTFIVDELVDFALRMATPTVATISRHFLPHFSCI